MYKANSDNILLELNLKTMFNANNVVKTAINGMI